MRRRQPIKNVDLKTNALTVTGAVRLADAAGREKLKERLIRHPLFRGMLIDGTGTTTAVIARLRKTEEHNVIETVRALRAAADCFAARHGLARPAVVGPPVLLADGFAAIEVDGRRLAAVGMVLIALVTLSAVHSVWWAIVPMISGWTIWLATETLLQLFHIKLSLSGGPLVAQIIVLTMPAASHLAIHFRDDCRARGRRLPSAGRLTLRAVAVPIIWTAITGAIGYGALITSDVVPIQQFGAILGICTLCSAILVMLICPIAMLPPFPLEIPVREGSSSRVAAAMNRLTTWVFHHPGAVVAAVAARGHSAFPGDDQPDLRDELHQPVPTRDPGREGLPDGRVTSSAGSAWSRSWSPWEPRSRRTALAMLGDVGRQIAAIPVPDPRAISQVLSLATVLDPDGRIAALPEAAQARILTNKVELISLSPQAQLLRTFWNPGDRRHASSGPAPGTAARPDQGPDLSRGGERGPDGCSGHRRSLPVCRTS